MPILPLVIDRATVDFEHEEIAVYVTSPDRPGHGHRLVLAWDASTLDRAELERRAAAAIEALDRGRELAAVVAAADRARRDRETHEAAADKARAELAQLRAHREELAGELAALELAHGAATRELLRSRPTVPELESQLPQEEP